ncbi:hypothetical protein F4779DRAFT_629265 [Xylariaceae sp. FL0662B]|nr:hypothetical protein F4779DRAFT_629265 [Xylariaceae sp. FL0662B]
MIEDYRRWKAMGEGGTRHNWLGYLSQCTLGKAMAFGPDDTITPGFYSNPKKLATGWSKATEAQKANATKSFMKEPLPTRPGPRARAKPFIYPQRERNAADPQSPELKQAYLGAFEQLSKTNEGFTEWKTSALEKHGRALFLKDEVPLTPLAATTQREICHIHTSDTSGHVTLSFVDAEEVIGKGWGERHRLSGTSWIHLGLVMLYVPNTVDEIPVFTRIYQAGIDYMRSG